MPIILAIETSSELASCAILNGSTVLTRESSGVRTHSQAILPMVQELLAEAGLSLAQCDLIAFGAGPGSFTGVRTACGIAQGLAFGASKQVVPTITLAGMALACQRETGATDIVTVLDARMGEVYWAQYRYADGALDIVHEPALCAPDQVAPSAATGLAACGNGIAAYPEAFAGKAWAEGANTSIVPHARDVAQLALTGHAVSAAEAQPLYLRNKIAYTSAERSAINAAKAAT
jgi:tRNA threonylcarbamoyladenosine biosynthesis protein TsaB